MLMLTLTLMPMLLLLLLGKVMMLRLVIVLGETAAADTPERWLWLLGRASRIWCVNMMGVVVVVVVVIGGGGARHVDGLCTSRLGEAQLERPEDGRPSGCSLHARLSASNSWPGRFEVSIALTSITQHEQQSNRLTNNGKHCRVNNTRKHTPV